MPNASGCPTRARTSEGFIDGLDVLLQSGRYDALIPGSDASLLAVSEHRERLEGSTRLGLPSREAVRRSVDKRLLLEVADLAGLAAPHSKACTDLEEAEAAASELGYPSCSSRRSRSSR